jgi:hypothetical protein
MFSFIFIHIFRFLLLLGEELCIFGVALGLAVERQRCHDGIALPIVVRFCVDHIEEHGLMLEGIYRSSGVKSKVNKLRAAFNSRTCSGVNLNDYEPAVVASVLKEVLFKALFRNFFGIMFSNNTKKPLSKTIFFLFP